MADVCALRATIEREWAYDSATQMQVVGGDAMRGYPATSVKVFFFLLFTQWKKMVMISALIGVAGFDRGSGLALGSFR
jgi:hypothetical protein